jgi:polygalacturonase
MFERSGEREKMSSSRLRGAPGSLLGKPLMITAISATRNYSITDFDAIADEESNNAPAIQQAIDECAEAGGGRVVIPVGTFKSGKIILRSRVELHLEQGAVLLCTENYSEISPEGTDFYCQGYQSAFICAEDAEDISITGAGVIDGNGRSYVTDRLPHIYVMPEKRPITVYLGGCNRVTISGITIRDGAAWTLWLCGCDDVLIHGIRLYNDLKLPNSDGIDLDRCRNVRISDCHIEAGDDAIVLKTMRGSERYGASENIIVRGCTLKSTSSAICIGCEVAAPIRNVLFDACVISSSHRGLAINHSYESVVENIVFSNMMIETRLFHDRWWGRGEPIYIKALPWTENDRVGCIRNVKFLNIQARSENGILVWGESPDRIEDIVFENVRLRVAKWSKIPGGQLDLRPCLGAENGYASGVVNHPVHAVMLRNARDVTFRKCEVILESNLPDVYSGMLDVRHVDPLRIEGLVAQSGTKNS